MGLAAPKNRFKLSHDPNNTKWTNDKSSFGHKIMTSQGWQPGDHLGVKGAAHAEFHTDANFSHIRVAIKDDNLGLGAKIGSGVGPGECTGLYAFQNLLGRLNGRDEEEMEKEQKSREDLKRAIYAEQRWGTIRFVKGGLLVGDKIQPLIEAEAERVRNLQKTDISDDADSSSSDDETTTIEEGSKKSKKRKLENVIEAPAEVFAVKVKKSKRRKLEQEVNSSEYVEQIKNTKKSKSKSVSNSTSEDDSAKSSTKKSKKQKRREMEASIVEVEDREAKANRKLDKEERRRKRREKKEQGGEKEEVEAKSKSKSKSKPGKKSHAEDISEDSAPSKVSTKEGTPLVADSSGRSTPMMQGRHAVRARNIAQKRLASMDVASLNQIFMIKS